MTFFHAVATNPFLQFTLWAGLFASIAGGIVGSYVVVKRIVFIGGSIAHAVLSGMGLFLFLERRFGIGWLSPMYGALLAALLAAWLLSWARRRFREREDSLIAAIWAVGMATGVIFIAQTPGYNIELTSFLLGNIVWTSLTDLVILGALDVIVVAIALVYHSRFLALCFDEDQARLQGVAVDGLYTLLLMLVAVTVVLLIQIVGIILVMTMLTIPAAVASIATRRLSTMMITAIILGMLFCSVGTAVSYTLNWPVGATIALTAGAAYLITLVVQGRGRSIFRQKRPRPLQKSPKAP